MPWSQPFLDGFLFAERRFGAIEAQAIAAPLHRALEARREAMGALDGHGRATAFAMALAARPGRAEAISSHHLPWVRHHLPPSADGAAHAGGQASDRATAALRPRYRAPAGLTEVLRRMSSPALTLAARTERERAELSRLGARDEEGAPWGA